MKVLAAAMTGIPTISAVPTCAQTAQTHAAPSSGPNAFEVDAQKRREEAAEVEKAYKNTLKNM
jgi:hypothetical protein